MSSEPSLRGKSVLTLTINEQEFLFRFDWNCVLPLRHVLITCQTYKLTRVERKACCTKDQRGLCAAKPLFPVHKDFGLPNQ